MVVFAMHHVNTFLYGQRSKTNLSHAFVLFPFEGDMRVFQTSILETQKDLIYIDLIICLQVA